MVYSRSVIKRLKAQAPEPFEAGVREGLRLAISFGLEHDITNLLTGEHQPDCPACKLLKEWGIENVSKE